MAKSYFERRISSARGSDSVSADMMRHLHTRQHLGKAIIVCEQPTVMLSAGRKQWLKLSRVIQRQRSSTLNADKILKLTHTITHMQRMHFTSKEPLHNPLADVFFLLPTQLDVMPSNCYSVYMLPKISEETARHIITSMPQDGLIIDYNHSCQWLSLGLEPKNALEKQVLAAWKQACEFMQSQGIDPSTLYNGTVHNISAMDDALDTLLGMTHKFLSVANDFQRTLELARPLRLSSEIRQQYDSFVLLAHRVQALSSESFTQRFLEIYNEDDTFFLYDTARRYLYEAGSALPDVIRYHQAHGRHNLAHALANSAFLTQGTHTKKII